LRQHGIIPEKPPSPTPIIQEALEQARRLAHENRLEGKELDELDELEDDEDEEFLNSYRYCLPTCYLALCAHALIVKNEWQNYLLSQRPLSTTRFN
jgi:hypothetical protein